MIDFGRPFATAYHPARAFLLHRGVLGLLAFDAWLEMIEHGGRYGLGGFNVSHFRVIDAVLPQVTPALYVGLLIFAGLLSLLMALGRASVAGKALLFASYTASWLISLHDSYQHHYLLSWILLWLTFVPDSPLAAMGERARPFVRGIGLPMMSFTCAIVYAFTGVAKSEPEWRAGTVLKRLSHSRPPGADKPGVLDPVRDLFTGMGFDDTQAWALIAGSVILLQWLVALGYLASVERDARPGPMRSVLCFLAFACAVSFHAFAEIGHMFEIGWFSYYMLWIAFVILTPQSWVSWLGAELTWPLRRIASWVPARELGTRVVAAALGASALALLVAGAVVHLPGTEGAVLVGQLCVLGAGASLLSKQRRRDAAELAFAGLLTAVGMWLALTQSSVRFDYHRRAAGEMQRMGLLVEALDNYRAAERYAPRGMSRRKKIDELEQKLAQPAP